MWGHGLLKAGDDNWAIRNWVDSAQGQITLYRQLFGLVFGWKLIKVLAIVP